MLWVDIFLYNENNNIFITVVFTSKSPNIVKLIFQDLCTTNLLEDTTTALTTVNNDAPIEQNIRKQIPVPKKEDKAAWFKLFAELDPLANPDNIPGSNSNQSHAA